MIVLCKYPLRQGGDQVISIDDQGTACGQFPNVLAAGATSDAIADSAVPVVRCSAGDICGLGEHI